MVVAIGIDSTDIGSMVHIVYDPDTDSGVHTVDDTGLVEKAQDGSAVVPVQPKPAHRSSSSRCLLSFPSTILLIMAY